MPFLSLGLRTNTSKTEVMACVAGRIRSPLDKDAYEDRMSDHHRAERKGQKVDCPTCGKALAVGSLPSQSGEPARPVSVFLALVAGKEGGRDPTCWEAPLYPEDGNFRCPVPNCPQGQAGAG